MNRFLRFQRRYGIWCVVLGILLAGVSFTRAVTLLQSIKTDLIHLLPDDYPTVQGTPIVQQKLREQNNLYLMISSSNPQASQQAMFAAKKHLEALSSVGKIATEKPGYDFFDRNKLLLIDLEDVYTLHDRLKQKIEQEKLGGLYIDFEEDAQKSGVQFDDIIKKYKDEFTEGVKSRYLTDETGTVYAINIFPKSEDRGLRFYKQFGREVEAHMATLDLHSISPDIQYGFAGAIATRVDQYDALIADLKRAGLISSISILVLIYFYYLRFIERRRTLMGRLRSLLYGLVPMVILFVPLMLSVIFAFAFCSLFIHHLNLVTSFLFAIIMGLGIDVGIHFMSRYIHDRLAGHSPEEIHGHVMRRTAKSAATSILTTAASFYILTISDFKGFSEFGWIAGNGLVIAFLCYVLFLPPLIFLAERFSLLPLHHAPHHRERIKTQRLAGTRGILILCVLATLLALWGVRSLHFEWDFGKLSMKFSHREKQKELLLSTHGRVNRPAVYLVDTPVQARKIAQVIQQRKAHDPTFPTIEFYRSYADMVPLDQQEKLALLQEIKKMLLDPLVLRSLKPEEKEMVDELLMSIDQTKPLTEKDIPAEVAELFFGPNGDRRSSVAYVMPLKHLQLNDGQNAMAFANDVSEVDVFGQKKHAISDAMIFADVIKTLFSESKLCITLSALVLLVIVAIDFRDAKRTAIVFLGLSFGILWMLAVMAFFDLKLNFYNMIVIPTMIGMGEDNSVHLIHRFEEIKRKSMVYVFKTTGGAALMASLTTMLGYSGLCFTGHPGLFSIGVMALVGLVTCLMGSLIVVPVLTQLFLKRIEEPTVT